MSSWDGVSAMGRGAQRAEALKGGVSEWDCVCVCVCVCVCEVCGE